MAKKKNAKKQQPQQPQQPQNKKSNKVLQVVKKRPVLVAILVIAMVVMMVAAFASQEHEGAVQAPPCVHANTRLVHACAASCITDGDSGCEVCVDCGAFLCEGSRLPATGHNFVLVGKVDASCTAEGNTGSEVCDICGFVQTPGESIPALNHQTKVEGKKAATCTENGHTGKHICVDCGVTVKKGSVIEATGHSFRNGTCVDCGAKEPVQNTTTTQVLPVRVKLPETLDIQSMAFNVKLEKATVTNVLTSDGEVWLEVKLPYAVYLVNATYANAQYTVGDVIEVAALYA